MATTTDTKRRHTTTVVTVRVPNGADGDITTEVERRLRRAEDILAVTVDALRDLQPGLSATEVTVAVTVETDDATVPAAIRELTGVEIET